MALRALDFLPWLFKKEQNLYFLGVLAVGSFALTCAIVLLWLKPKHYPPGPRGWPVVGHVFQLPPNKQWIQYDKWSKKYGH